MHVFHIVKFPITGNTNMLTHTHTHTQSSDFIVQKLCVVIYLSQSNRNDRRDHKYTFNKPHTSRNPLKLAWHRQYVTRLQPARMRIRGLVPSKEKRFVLLYSIQTRSGAQPASYWTDAGTLFPGVKQHQSEADHSPTSTAQVTNVWGHKYTGPICFYCVHKGKFTFHSACLLTVLYM